ncbi:hypothetical protein F5Y17DRAFT_476307 [Xylariaceae sp. FL0594]|nr:hypothetical protein F5Y17DRAFT_476307 [Xylariaceae sp. FL0594]
MHVMSKMMPGGGDIVNKTLVAGITTRDVAPSVIPVVIVAPVIAMGLAAVITCAIYKKKYGRRHAAGDLEAGGVELQTLPSVPEPPDRPSTPSATPVPPRPRTITPYNQGLSSHPPSLTDLATAFRASQGLSREDVRPEEDIPPVPHIPESIRAAPSTPTRPERKRVPVSESPAGPSMPVTYSPATPPSVTPPPSQQPFPSMPQSAMSRRPAMTSASDSGERRLGIVLPPGDTIVITQPIPRSGPGIQTMPEVLDLVNRRRAAEEGRVFEEEEEEEQVDNGPGDYYLSPPPPLAFSTIEEENEDENDEGDKATLKAEKQDDDGVTNIDKGKGKEIVQEVDDEKNTAEDNDDNDHNKGKGREVIKEAKEETKTEKDDDHDEKEAAEERA